MAWAIVEEGAERDSEFIIINSSGRVNEEKRATDCRTFRHKLPNRRCVFIFFSLLLSFRFHHVRSVVAEKSGQVTRLGVSKSGGGEDGFAGRNAARLVSAAGGTVGWS